MVKVVHIADVHLDTPLGALPAEVAALRRQQTRSAFAEVLDRAGREGADAVLLSGDLFDNGAATPDSLRVLSDAALRYPDTRFFVAPGNHDCLSGNSPYRAILRPANLYIFESGLMEKLDFPEYTVYGLGCLYENCEVSPLRDFQVEDPERINLMVLHSQAQGFGGHQMYNPITTDEIRRSGLTYLALGHVHAWSGILSAGKTVYAYPGALVGHGFDETGEKGYIAGRIEADRVDLHFVPCDCPSFEWVTADLGGAQSMIDVLAAIEAAVGEKGDGCILKLTLAGERRADLPLNYPAIRDALSRFSYVKIEDETKASRDYERLAAENTLTGLFIRNIMDAQADAACKEAALSYGLAALSGEELTGIED